MSAVRTLSGLAVLAALSMSACPASAAGGDSWEVLAPGLPGRVAVADASLNVPFYILKQTHEPVFRREDGDNYSSRILKKWSRSLDNRDYLFCPDLSLEFAPGMPFTFSDFISHISSFTSVYTSSFTVIREGDCARIRFDSGERDYLYFWRLYEYAPTKTVADGSEIGLGAFYVENISKDRITLARKKPRSGIYNSVILHDYKGAGDPNLENRNIKDFNLINATAVPGWVKESFLSFDNPEMKVLVLLINHPDPKVRERIYNCAEIPALGQAFFPGKKDFYPIATVLPMGVPGAVPGLPLQECGPGGTVSGRLRFANWMQDNSGPMEKFARSFKARSGLTLRVDQYDMGEFSRAFSLRPKPFDLAVISIYVPSSPKEFFSTFFANDGAYDFDTRPLSRKCRRLLELPGSGTAEDMFKALSEEVAANFLALPISQNKRVLYYPKEIKNMSVGKGIIEYPEIAEFRR